MPKQKRGFLLFVCSLVPGAGELYMGFQKQGLSIMTIFWGVVALASALNFGFLLIALPIIWCYSFFQVHNLKSLTEEEFQTVQDDYAIHMEELFGDKREFFTKYRTQISLGIIFLGVLILWNCVPVFFGNLLPDFFYPVFGFVFDVIPRLIAAFAIIGFGVFLITRNHNRTKSAEDYPEIEENR